MLVFKVECPISLFSEKATFFTFIVDATLEISQLPNSVKNEWMTMCSENQCYKGIHGLFIYWCFVLP